jgi:hypothetical protein
VLAAPAVELIAIPIHPLVVLLDLVVEVLVDLELVLILVEDLCPQLVKHFLLLEPLTVVVGEEEMDLIHLVTLQIQQLVVHQAVLVSSSLLIPLHKYCCISTI